MSQSIYELVLNFGYVGLFLFSFIAATLISAPSDVAAMIMVAFGYNVVLVVLVATAGGFLGKSLNYLIGLYGVRGVHRLVQRNGEDKVPGWVRWLERTFAEQEDEAQQEDSTARKLIDRFGAQALLLSGLPLIGDPLSAIAGALHIDYREFAVYVVLGTSLKFVVLMWIVYRIVGFGGTG